MCTLHTFMRNGPRADINNAGFTRCRLLLTQYNSPLAAGVVEFPLTRWTLLSAHTATQSQPLFKRAPLREWMETSIFLTSILRISPHGLKNKCDWQRQNYFIVTLFTKFWGLVLGMVADLASGVFSASNGDIGRPDVSCDAAVFSGSA